MSQGKGDSMWVWVAGGGAALLLLLLSRRSKAAALPAADKPGIVDRQLTTNFRESEFKRSSHPELHDQLQRYRLNAAETANLRQLADVLQTARNAVGPVKITGGGRPEGIKDSQGRGFYEYLKAKGHEPSRTSQHIDFAGADIVVLGQGRDPNLAYVAFRTLANDPRSNQTILYIKGGKPGHIHASIRQPHKGGKYDRPKAWLNVDGQNRSWDGLSNPFEPGVLA